MLPSILTTFLFAASGVFGRRSAMMMGALPANFARLLIATAVLGAMTWTLFPATLKSGPVFNWFFFSGVIGFGMGDLALFLAFQRIGSRLTVLLTQCLAAPIAALAEFLWMGTTISLEEAGSAVLIFTGVALAIAPGARSLPHRSGSWTAGIVFGVVAAAGQGLGATVSRQAELVAAIANQPTHGIGAAFQRILGGVLVAGLAVLLAKAWRGRRDTAAITPRKPPRAVWKWIVANAFAGSILGVSCYQWALADFPSAIVLAIVATTPIVIMPLAWWMEGDAPGRRSAIGAVIAVSGACLLCLLQAG